MSPKFDNHIWQSRPPGSYYKGERIDHRPGETFGEALMRHQNAKAKQPTTLAKTPEPDRSAEQNANAELLKSNAAEIANLRQLADKHPAPKPVAEPSKPVALSAPDVEPRKRTGFAAKINVANGIKVFGSNHEQRSS